MFDKLKQLKQLRDIQNQLAKEKTIVEKEGTNVRINGKMEIEWIGLNPELPIERQEKILKDCINDAVRKMQIKMAESMQKLGKLGNFGL